MAPDLISISIGVAFLGVWLLVGDVIAIDRTAVIPREKNSRGAKSK